LETLLSCAERMKNNHDIHFLIIGEGDLKADYQNRCAELPNITFAPGVPKAMVQSVLSQCDLLYFSVLPSKVWEFGLSLNKIIDYMLAGKPILASYTGYPSMITEAECGSFVPSGEVEALQNEIMRYAQMSKATREEIGARGKAWILINRSYPTLARKYLEIMSKTVKGPTDLAGDIHPREFR
ncbi:MAG: glycosyltransferase, partial [Planktotalea sp.]|uniref:glycosyltransferase n=1 Tax=Planktotalea sp. TaxID=2029877 RepID=UPI003C768B2F